MPLAKEDMDFIKTHFDAWLTEKLPEQKPGVYDLELTVRIDRFMRWSFGLTLTVAGIIIAVLKFT